MLTDDKQKAEGAKKMCNRQAFSASFESQVAELGPWGKPAEEASGLGLNMEVLNRAHVLFSRNILLK